MPISDFSFILSKLKTFLQNVTHMSMMAYNTEEKVYCTEREKIEKIVKISKQQNVFFQFLIQVSICDVIRF